MSEHINPEDYDEYGVHLDTRLVGDLIQRVRSAKSAFNIPIGDSRRSDDRDYLEEVGRMTLERLHEIYPKADL